ncbi:MAG: carboxypeptidase-like regulatory domain-containing protein [Bacteroidales bacterium]|nr:carboxypeptidase-like regulatory domain-containing protein [Bacteroidales bacterium]
MKGLCLKTLLVCMLLIHVTNPVKSQQMISLSGIVLDSLTGNGLPFAQISVQHSTVGTVTNDEGYFILDVPVSMKQDTLLVAFMGYGTMKHLVSGSAGNSIRYSLIPGAMQLAEVEIVALSSEEVIRRVVANIPENYGRDSLILTAFIRSQKFVGGKLSEYTEAIIEDLKTGYNLYDRKEEKTKSRQSNVPLLLKGRVISDTSLVNSIGELGKSAGCLGCNFIHDFVEFYHNTVLDEKMFRNYSFKMEELIKPEGGKIYRIWFDQKKGVKETLWRGELIINGADFALLKITQKPSYQAFDYYEKKKYRRPYSIRNISGWYQEMPIMEWTTTYAARNGTYYLNTIRIENWLTFINPSTNQKLKYAHKNEVVVTGATRDPEKLRHFIGDKSIGMDQRWDQVVGKGDEHFWAGYNYLPIEEKLRDSLKKLVNW